MFFKKLFYCTFAFLPMVIAAEPVSVTPKIDPVISFQQNMDKYNFLTQEQKGFYAGVPSLSTVEAYLKETGIFDTLSESEINLAGIKEKAKAFFSRLLSPSQHSDRLISIVNEVIDRGEYAYTPQFSDVMESKNLPIGLNLPIGSMKKIPESLIEVTEDEDAEKEVSRVMDVIVDLLEGNDPSNEQKFADTNEANGIKIKYLNPDNIAKNFRILVVYNNELNAFVTLMHETAHILDIATRLLNNWLIPTVRTNSESVSLLFETLAYHEWNPKFVQVPMYLRITDAYHYMIQVDFISKFKAASAQTEEQTDEIFDKIYDQVNKSWKSTLKSLNDNYNYIDFNLGQNNELLSQPQSILTYANESILLYLPHTVRAHFMVRQILNGTEFNFDEEIKKLIHEKAPAVTCAELAEIFKEKI